MKLRTSRLVSKIAMLLAILCGQLVPVVAQDAESPTSPAGLAMLVLFLGIAAMIGVLVIRWSQTSGDEEE